MSKDKRPASDPTPEAPIAPADNEETIEWYRRCPICWGARSGVGLAYGKQGKTRYYKCSRNSDGPGCGHTWTATVELTVVKVEHRMIELNERKAT